MKTLRKSRASGLATAALLAAHLPASPLLEAGVVSPIVTASKWTVPAGSTLLSTPAYASPSYAGAVASVSGNVITLAGTPGFTAGAFAPVDPGTGTEFYQYLVSLRFDASTEGRGNQGDWWLVEDNGTGTLTVAPSPVGGTLASRLATGDLVEVTRLLSVKDVFGAGAGLRLNADDDFDDSTGDAVRVMVGTTFGAPLFHHDGSLDTAGWYYDYSLVGDGSTVTLYPDQALMVVHAGAATDLHVPGVLRTYSFTHYLASGPNPLSTGFAAPAPIGTSGLKEAGFLDTDFDDSTEDTVRLLVGTTFGVPLFYHTGSEPEGWYADYSLDNTYPLDPGLGVILFTDGPMVWRQPEPFVP